ncbi:ATP-binding protein [Labilibacter sediminis]|nr:ATP-binding protein [Labilibacter sediminis]
MVLKSDIKNISLVEKLIDDISVQFDIHADVYGKLLLAIVEGVNNAIVHGNKLDSNKDVELEYQVSDKVVEFVITDQGSGFDFTDIPDPTLPENVEKTHGRGIFLMNHLADDIDFENNGSKVKLSFNL